MAEAVVSSPPPAIASIQRKLFALGVFALAALLLYYLDRLPSALALDDHREWRAARNESLVLYGLPDHQLLEFNGALGAGLGVRAKAVRPSPEMVEALVQAGVRPPARAMMPLTWLGRTDAGGKIGFTVANRRKSPRAGLAITARGDADIPQLRLTPVDTALTFAFQAIPGDSATVPPITLSIGDAAVGQPIATMMPVRFELPPGRSVVLTFPRTAAMADASFRLGRPAFEDELASNLPVDRFEISGRRVDRPGAGSARAGRGVCGADAGSFLLRRLSPRPEDCGSDGTLAIESLDVKPEQLAIEVSGNGFVTTGDGTIAAGLLTGALNNKLVAALLALALGTLAAWVWKTVTGMGKP